MIRQFSQTRNEQTISMQNQILNLTYQLEGTYFFSDDWLASLEHDHRLIIHIEENNVPLFFSGSWEPRTNRDTLVDMAKEMALTEHIDTSIRPFSSTLQRSAVYWRSSLSAVSCLQGLWPRLPSTTRSRRTLLPPPPTSCALRWR